MLKHLIVVLLLLFTRPILAADAPDLDDQTRAIANELRCVVCQNLSVADSPSEMAQQMRAIVREQLQAGKTPQEIKNYFVSKYGEWVLLAPTTRGFSLVVWVLPFVVLVAGLGLGIWFVRRWATRGNKLEPKAVDPALLARVRNEAATAELIELDPEDSGPQSQLRQERARLYADLKELEFDYQAGRLSEADYNELRQGIEAKAAVVLQELDSVARRPTATQAPTKIQRPSQPSATTGRFRGWRIAAGGVFLLLFGVTLGVVLTKSVRPRGSEQDSMTGDFLTGTGSGGPVGNKAGSPLQEGKAAFAKQEWPKAIEAFKRVLAADPNQPEAHAYMGLILVQAGHADGALAAFDKALATAPNLPMALWGKGMVLYREKQDYAGARQILAKLLQLMPPGQERSEVEKLLAEIPQSAEPPRQAPVKAPAATPSSQQITGTITIDPKVKNNMDSRAALFIIARPAGPAGGPPLAVRKIERPVFPLSYSLGSENVMMQGQPFSGKVSISVRLDQDGNPMTREPGTLVGDYKKNPVAVGSKNVDIVIDQVAQ